jgi:hypothetical protein
MAVYDGSNDRDTVKPTVELPASVFDTFSRESPRCSSFSRSVRSSERVSIADLETSTQPE